MNDKKDVYDCAIVGGGSAGLSAAITLGRARRRVLVCDKGTPRNAPAHAAHGFFTRDGANPLELLRIAREQLQPYETVEFESTGVKEIKKSDEQFTVVLENNAAARARKIVFAFGVKDEFPPIENFAEFWGKTVFHCPFCHGYEVRDRPLAIFGNGATAIEMTALLKNWTADLTVCTNGAAEFSDEQRKLLAKYEVAVREEKIVRFEGKRGQLETIVFAAGESLARSGMLIRPKQRLRSDLAEKLGCELTQANLIKTANINETTVTGVFAAGDIARPMQSIALAVASGAMAAAGVMRALNGENFV